MKFSSAFSIALMLLGAGGAHAKEPTADELCEIEGSLASVVMEGRQMGIPLSSMLKMVSTAPGGSKEMVLSAYEEPAYSTDSMKQKTTTEFANQWLLRCYRSQ